MKKIIATVLIFIAIKSQSQITPIYVVNFPGNDSAIYITNTGNTDGLKFFFDNPNDVHNSFFYIPNFKTKDFILTAEKIKIMNAKLIINKYISKPGDLIFTFNYANKLIYITITAKTGKNIKT